MFLIISSNIAKKVADKLGPARKNYKNYLTQPTARSFFISPVTTTEVKLQIMNLDDCRSPGSYDIPIKMVKCVSETTFNKIFEKLMHQRLVNFLKVHNVIFPHQFGFQENKSTFLAILDVYNKLVNAIEKRETSCCIFLDLAKALDTVDHEILLYKLNHYGIRGTA